MKTSFQQVCNIAYTLTETNAYPDEMRDDNIPVFLNTINLIGLKMETSRFKNLYKYCLNLYLCIILFICTIIYIFVVSYIVIYISGTSIV